MTEAQSTGSDPADVPGGDTSSAVADSQAPAHLEERGLDKELESALDQGENGSPG
jgi:hypothetical protein